MRSLLALTLFAAACGNDLHHGIDAPPADAKSDSLGSTTGDAPADAVKLTVKRGTSPVANVAVYFLDPDQAVIHAALTNEQGLAFAAMPTGGTVTAIEHVGEGLDELATFTAVQPADALRLDYMDPGQTKLWPFKITIPPLAGATSYVVYTSCSSETYGISNPAPATSEPDNEILLAGCDDGIADFVILAYDVDGNLLDTSLYAPDVVLPDPPAAQPTDAMPPVYNPLALTGTYQLRENHTLEYTNVPASIAWIGAFQGISALRRAYEVTSSVQRTASTISTTVEMISDATTQLTVSVGYPANPAQKGQQIIYDWGAASPTYTLDAGGSLIPPYESTPIYDPATRQVTWDESGGPLSPNVVRARIHVFRDDIPSGRAWGWRIIGPRTATTVAYPRLPVDDFDFNPRDTDTFGVDELTTVLMPGGYAGWRATGFADLARAVVGAQGRMVVQTLYFEVL